ncbi:MAG TPA: DUF4332 domain-containing protein [Leptolyngbyaceae cyanobacterium M65_K2018_010]|nr:DUF4332 domain-containing protein [Leptolyngbyaceae cyanobacterium M65_K2018_010]
MTDPHPPIHQLPGLSTSHGQALAQLGLTTTTHLYHYGQTAAGRRHLAQKLQVPPRYVAKWVALADLARIPAVGCEFSGLLLHAGVLSVAQLAESNPQNLHGRVQRLHVKTLQRADLCPTPDQVSAWIQAARSLQAAASRHSQPDRRQQAP